jgi:hypothetical protein
MKKFTILALALLVWAVAGGALAGGQSALINTNWAGALTFIDVNGNMISDNATLTFTDETGDFLAGTLSCTTGSVCGKLPLPATPVAFSCIRAGDALQMAFVEGHMFAAIYKGHPVKKGNRPPPQMWIQGSNFQDGDMFRGTLTKQ